ncbi:hypothetical protein T492DRAFT_1105303 [Pavlovales sp. CCMP2436]|nr:hypothetical protein T492DRAFT_1105303 [Pavlovales sp. CCMP2436]
MEVNSKFIVKNEGKRERDRDRGKELYTRERERESALIIPRHLTYLPPCGMEVYTSIYICT